jgi:hypothetical protein
VAIRNPALSQSCQQLRILGLGNVGDDSDGTTRVLGRNLDTIYKIICAGQRGMPYSIKVEEARHEIQLDIYVVLDMAALRHCEHPANSGWCCCARDVALRQVSKKPDSVPETIELLKQCVEPTRESRYIWAHMPLPGETLPRPCTAPGCKYTHDTSKAADELAELLATEAKLSARSWRRQRQWRR